MQKFIRLNDVQRIQNNRGRSRREEARLEEESLHIPVHLKQVHK